MQLHSGFSSRKSTKERSGMFARPEDSFGHRAFVISFDIAYCMANYSRRFGNYQSIVTSRLRALISLPAKASDLGELRNAAWIPLAGSISDATCQPIVSLLECVLDWLVHSTIVRLSCQVKRDPSANDRSIHSSFNWASRLASLSPSQLPFLHLSKKYTDALVNSFASQNIWQLALGRVLFGTGSSGVLLLAIVMLTGSHDWYCA